MIGRSRWIEWPDGSKHLCKCRGFSPYHAYVLDEDCLAHDRVFCDGMWRSVPRELGAESNPSIVLGSD